MRQGFRKCIYHVRQRIKTPKTVVTPERTLYVGANFSCTDQDRTMSSLRKQLIARVAKLGVEEHRPNPLSRAKDWFIRRLPSCIQKDPGTRIGLSFG